MKHFDLALQRMFVDADIFALNERAGVGQRHFAERLHAMRERILAAARYHLNVVAHGEQKDWRLMLLLMGARGSGSNPPSVARWFFLLRAIIFLHQVGTDRAGDEVLLAQSLSTLLDAFLTRNLQVIGIFASAGNRRTRLR
jgi:hypothetical protein